IVFVIGVAYWLIVSSSPAPAGSSAAGARVPYDFGVLLDLRLFGEGTISTEDDESNGSFSPDGFEYYFTKFNPSTTRPHWALSCVRAVAAGRWTARRVPLFTGWCLLLSPRFPPGGKPFSFSSSRPAPGKPARGLRICFVERTSGGGGGREPLPPPVNAGDAD